MSRKEISINLDRDNRNNHNKNYEDLYDRIETTKTMINDLVLDSGESNAEVAQARGGHQVLSDRLNKTDQQLADVYLKSKGININDFDEPTRQTFLEAQGIDVNYVLGKNNVKPENTTFLNVGKNLYDKNSVTPLTTIIISNGNITSSSANTTHPPIPVKENTDYHLSDTQGSTIIVGFYNYDTGFIRTEQLEGNNKITTPALTDYVILAVRQDKINTFQFEQGSVGTPYQPFRYELKEDISVKIDDREYLKRDVFKKQLNLVDGSISNEGADVIGPNRVKSLGLIDITAGTTLVIKTPQDYQVSIYDEKSRPFTWTGENQHFPVDTRIRFMIRSTPPERNVTIKEAEEQITIRSPQHVALLSDVSNPNNGGSEAVKYVSLNGSDNSNGESLSTGYATLQKAVESGATTVYVERGEYYNQRFTAGAKSLTILPANNLRYNEKPVKKIKFIGANRLTNLTSDGTIYSQAFSGGRNFTEYFIDKTIGLTTSGTRPQYNVILWEVFEDSTQDYVMKPVLTLSEVESEQGVFYWDGTKIYVNPKDSSNQFFVPTYNVGLDFSKVDKLTATDLVSDFYLITPFNLDNVSSFKLQNCEANHSGYSDGFSTDYANGTFEHCWAYKNRNDGFNMHFYGDTVLINCYGLDNYDDGVSHHEHTTGTIIGGEFSRNGKAGSAPVANAMVNMYDVWLEGNDYGILSSRASERNIYKGNIVKGNRIGISNNVENTRFVDNKLIENQTDTVGKVSQI